MLMLASTRTAVLDQHHSIHLYGSEDRLCRSVATHLADGFRVGMPALLIVRPERRARIAHHLGTFGIEPDLMRIEGELAIADAAELLARILVDAAPSAERFEQAIDELLQPLGERRIRAYGEMVDLLCQAHNVDAAAHLERLWTDLVHTRDLDLICACSAADFCARPAELARLCEAHDHVTVLDDLRESSIDGVAAACEIAAQIGRRKEVEAHLHGALEDLRESEEDTRDRADRIAALQTATARLAALNEVGAVTDTTVEIAVQLFEAAAIALYLFDCDGELRLHASYGVDEAKRAATLSLDQPLPLVDAIRCRSSIWIESYDQLIGMYPSVAYARTRASKLCSVATVPLIHGDVVVGGLALSFARPHEFDAFERECLESLAQQVALAVDRARLYAAEHLARSEAQLLLGIAESLNEPGLDIEALLRRVTDTATQLTGAKFGAFFSVDDTAILPEEHASSLIVPVRAQHGELLGRLCFGHPATNRFTEQHERMVSALAASAAIALQNAKRITDLRKAGDEQRQLVEDLSETLHLNELFTGVLAHDLRNPLSAVTAAAQVVIARGEQSGNAADVRTAYRILASAQRMARMIDHLLDFTRVRLGAGMPLEPRACDLKVVLSQVVDELTAGGCHIRFEIAGDTHGTWDEDRLGQVFSNLLGNAHQHGDPQHGVTVRFDGTSDTEVHVEVHNHGAIPPDLVPRLFLPMVGGERRRDGSRGLGLGLYITHEITRRHGGAIAVASSVEDGTRFTVTMPRHASLEAAVPDRSPLMRRNTARSRERFLFDTVRDHAILLLDTEGCILSWNKGAEITTGYGADEIVGKHISELYTLEDRRRGTAQLLLQRALDEGHIEDEAWRVRKDGSRFWANVVITPLNDENGVHAGFAKITRDLTERKKLEEERLRLAEANEGIRLRDEFLSIVSHELKTPLTGLQLQLDLLVESLDGSDARVVERLRRATLSSDRLTQLIESLLDVSRIATGRFVLACEEVDLARLAEEVIDSFRSSAAKTGTTLSLTVEGPTTGTWDRVRLAQVLTNLLSNAIKYGGGQPVEIRVESDDDEVVLVVRDRGPGIAIEDRERIFGRFERASSARHFGGLGIGLYVVKEIVTAHGGTVMASNAPDGGACLTVCLPCELGKGGLG